MRSLRHAAALGHGPVNKAGQAVNGMSGFIREADTVTIPYRGYRLTVTSEDVIVHAQIGTTTARFASMAAARAFVRMLRSQ